MVLELQKHSTIIQFFGGIVSKNKLLTIGLILFVQTNMAFAAADCSKCESTEIGTKILCAPNAEPSLFDPSNLASPSDRADAEKNYKDWVEQRNALDAAVALPSMHDRSQGVADAERATAAIEQRAMSQCSNAIDRATTACSAQCPFKGKSDAEASLTSLRNSLDDSRTLAKSNQDLADVTSSEGN